MPAASSREVARVDAIGAGGAAELAALAQITEPVVGREEERLHADEQDCHGQPGRQPGEDGVRHDPPPAPSSPSGSLVRVVADQDARHRGDHPVDGLNGNDQQEADRRNQSHPDAHPGGRHGPLVDEPGHAGAGTRELDGADAGSGLREAVDNAALPR